MNHSNTFIQNPNAPIHHKIKMDALFSELEKEAIKGCGCHDDIFDDNMNHLVKSTIVKLDKMSAENDLQLFIDEATRKGYISQPTEEEIQEQKQRQARFKIECPDGIPF